MHTPGLFPLLTAIGSTSVAIVATSAGGVLGMVERPSLAIPCLLFGLVAALLGIACAFLALGRVGARRTRPRTSPRRA